MREDYRRTVELLLDIAPRVFEEPDYAMKGGTAINLFVQDFPRLSVDIDLVYLPVDHPRDHALAAIDAALDRISEKLQRMPDVDVRRAAGGGDEEVRILVTRARHTVKVEVNHVFRGTVYPWAHQALSPRASQTFRREVQLPVLAEDELYGSKLVAAMDRQHPRDIFDVMLVLSGDGITHRMRRAFVVYAASCRRPINELLTPNPKPLEALYRTGFDGMTAEPVPLARLEETRANLFRELPASLDDAERRFLLSVKACEPDWGLLGLPGIERLPGLTWKLENVRRLKRSNAAKYKTQFTALKRKLQL